MINNMIFLTFAFCRHLVFKMRIDHTSKISIFTLSKQQNKKKL